jgi:hypothetical protein
MKLTLVSICLVLIAILAPVPGGGGMPGMASVALGQESGMTSSIDAQQELVNEYCVVCHDPVTPSGGFSWDSLDLAHPELDAEQAETVIRKLRSGMMPPVGVPRPEMAALKSLAAGIEMRIDQAAAAEPHISAPELHRVNRTEYRNSVRDLLDLDVDVTDLLPPDPTTNGFDNLSDSLTISPALMGAYIRAAEKISRDAVGDPEATPGMTLYKVSRLANQMRHVPGTPFGTRGGTSVLHTFPADGEYSFHVTFYHYYPGELVGIALPEQLQGQEIEISVDGERVAVMELDPDMKEEDANYVTEPFRVAAGQRRLAVAFVAKFDGPVQDHYRLIEQTLADTTISVTPQLTGLPHVQAFSVTGPYNPTGVSDSASRRKIFTCRPAAGATSSEEEACASQIISELAGKAFRRPVTPEDLESLLDYYEQGASDRGFESGVQAAIQAILAKPEFIFRFEQEPRDAAPGTAYQITDLELASRLAYFLWSTIPDEELTRIASEGRLRDPGVLENQVQRMVRDPRSEQLSRNFAGQWLRLAGLKQVYPEALEFPNFTANLAESMRREVELLFDYIMREDRDALELLSADYTFVDENLARHYGIQNIVGPRFKRVPLTDPNRFGLLGKAGVLTMTSLANRTSPVSRGKYVIEVMVGTPAPKPPPVVPPLAESVDNEVVLSVRQRMEKHRESPACNACHRIMDPIGLALENFDAVGAWRRTDGGVTIDPTGEMYDGTKLDGPASVREAVMARPEAFIGSFTTNLLSYGVGRVLDYRDMPAVRSIQRQAAENGNRLSSFIMGVVKSPLFQMRAVTSETEVEAGRQQ